MPWTKENVKKHKKGLTDAEEEQWVAIANSALKKCMEDGGSEEVCAVSAIKQANGATEEKSEPRNVEVRIIPNEDSEVRSIPNSRKIEGYGIIFNKESRNLGGFTEIILPQAVEGVLGRSDILALLNHEVNKGVLARSTNGKGTLKLDIDERGVKYSFEAPKFDLGDELVEGVRRGDIKGSSFAFSLGEDEWDYKRKPALRTIKKFGAIYDMSPCYREAYQDTTVALRSLEERMKEDVKDITEIIEFKDNAVSTTEVETKSMPEEPVVEPIVEVKKEKPIVREPKHISNNLKELNMTLVELRSARADRIAQNKEIFTLKDTEKRDMTPDEESLTMSNNQKIKELDLQIETETRSQGEGKVVGPYFNVAKKEPFSLLKAIRAKVEQREIPGVARDLFVMGRDEFRNCGVNPMGDIVLPSQIETRVSPILAGSAGVGQEIVAEDKRSILGPLTDRLVFAKAGATFMTGLTGTVSIPSYAGTTVDWKTEVAAAIENEGAFSEVTFSPLRLTAFMLVSKLFLVQDTVGAERLLLANIANAVARQLEKTILGPADQLAGSYPQGMGYMINNASTRKKTVLTGPTITWAKMVGLETSVDTANALDGNLAYITNGIARGILKTTDKGLSNDTGDFMIEPDGTMNGYPVLVTNSIVSTYGTGGDGNAVFFGNWADLCVAQWGGYDITIDPYSNAYTNQVKIVINSYFDAKGLRGSVGTTPNDTVYAYSFAAESVK